MIIEEETKRFVTKGLINVLKDIEVTSMNIDQLLQMQSLSIDSLTSDVSLIRSRLHGMKSQHLCTSLDEMKVPYSTSSSSAPGVQTGILSVREIEVDYARRAPNHTINSTGDDVSVGATEQSSTITGSIGVPADDNAPAAAVLVSSQKRQKISMEERCVSCVVFMRISTLHFTIKNANDDNYGGYATS